MYRLIVVWYTGEKEMHDYKTRAKAESIAAGYKMVFGNQIEYTCVFRV